MSAPSDPLPPEDPTIAMTPPVGAASILPAAPLALREVIGDFEVLGRLGQGGMGAVYRARQVSLDRMVALKVLPGQFIEDAASVARFQREARVAAGLSHANLVHVYASGEADGCHFIAMELIEGEDLGRRLKRDGALPATEALRIGLAVAEGLQHGWQNAHLIHRDIKPANIFLADDGTVKLGDLGLAKSLLGNSTGLTQSGTMMGTPHYISPEQARGDRELDFRADIYSLGCTLFQMLTGQVPYRGADAIAIIRQHLDAPLPAILKVWPQCPLPMARLVGKMLKKARHERHGSYAELIAQMKSVWAQIDPVGFEPESFAPPRSAFEAEAPEAPAEVPPRAPAPPPPARSRLPLYGGIVAGVAVLAVVTWMVWPKTEKLTQAQLTMARRIVEKNAPPATPPPPAAVVAETKVPAAPVSTAPEPAAIKLWDAPEKIPEGTRWEDNALRLDGVTAFYVKRKSRDAVIRASIRMNPDGTNLNIALRESGNYAARTQRHYHLQINPKAKSVWLLACIDSRYPVLKEWRLPRAYGADEWARLELRAVGDELTASLDGQVLGTVHDSSITEPGGVILHASANGYFRDIEYVPLDKVGAESANGNEAARRTVPENAAPASTPAATTEPWRDVLHDPAKLDLSGGAVRTPEGVRFTPGSAAMLRSSQGPQRDGAVRMRATFGGLPPALYARWTSAAGYYSLGAKSEKLTLQRNETATKQYTILRVFPLREPLQPGQDLELELRVVGQTLTAKLNGEILGSATDGTFPEGILGGAAGRGDSTVPTLLKSLEVLDLDARVGASAPPAAAYPQPRAWIEVTDKVRSDGLKAGSLVADGEWLALATGAKNHYSRFNVKWADVAVRVVFSHAVNVHLRFDANSTRYVAGVKGPKAYVQMYEPIGFKTTVLGSRDMGASYEPDAEHEFVFAAQADRLSLWVDGKEVIGVREGTLRASGPMEVVLLPDQPGKTPRIKKVEYGELEPAGTNPPAVPPAPK